MGDYCQRAGFIFAARRLELKKATPPLAADARFQRRRNATAASRPAGNDVLRLNSRAGGAEESRAQARLITEAKPATRRRAHACF